MRSRVWGDIGLVCEDTPTWVAQKQWLCVALPASAAAVAGTFRRSTELERYKRHGWKIAMQLSDSHRCTHRSWRVVRYQSLRWPRSRAITARAWSRREWSSLSTNSGTVGRRSYLPFWQVKSGLPSNHGKNNVVASRQSQSSSVPPVAHAGVSDTTIHALVYVLTDVPMEAAKGAPATAHLSLTASRQGVVFRNARWADFRVSNIDAWCAAWIRRAATRIQRC